MKKMAIAGALAAALCLTGVAQQASAQECWRGGDVSFNMGVTFGLHWTPSHGHWAPNCDNPCCCPGCGYGYGYGAAYAPTGYGPYAYAPTGYGPYGYGAYPAAAPQAPPPPVAAPLPPPTPTADASAVKNVGYNDPPYYYDYNYANGYPYYPDATYGYGR